MNCEPEIIDSKLVRENYDELVEIHTYSCEKCDEYKCSYFWDYNNKEDYDFIDGEV